MLKDADLGGDNEEKKEEIEERLEELEGIKDTLEKQFELLESYKKSKEVLKDK
jgi:anion-transporting  ArsA/GET3 family ATPase